MAITRNELLEALRKVVSSEFEHIPKNEEEIDFTFSERFMKRMLRLFRNRKKPYWKYVNTAAKRVAVAFLAAALLFATACSIKPIREPIMRFITEIYETFTAYFFEGDTVDTIEKEYSLSAPPEGFVQTDKVVFETLITTVYQNDLGNTITISQMPTNKSKIVLDREMKSAKIETINGIETIIYDLENRKQAMWIKDHYYFDVVATGNVDVEILKKIVADLK